MSAKIPRAGYLTVPGSPVSAAQVVETACAVVRHQVFTNPPLAVVNGIIATLVAGPNIGTVTILPVLMDGATAALGVIPWASGMNVTVVVHHASSIVACNGVITGYDMYGNVITETWSVTATGTDKTYTGTKAFKQLTSITFVSAGDARTNELKAGFGVTLGLDRICRVAVRVLEEMDGAVPTAGVIVKGVAASATADARGTYAPNTAPDGAHDYDLWYLVEDVTAITQ